MTAERFDCFISYSRASSTQLAIDLQSGLERFAKPWHKLRAIRVFRDDQSMAANTALWGTIEKGLVDARWFILLATPESAASQYVNQEVAWWLHNKGPHTLLLVRAGGVIEWDRTTGAFATTCTAIPPALRFGYAQEPRWIDFAWFGEPGSLGNGDPRFTERVADLASAVRGIERDALIGENVRQHRRMRRLARTAVAALSVLLVLALGAGLIAFIQRGEAVRQRDTAYEKSLVATARQMAATAVNAAETNLQTATLLATTAYKTRPENQTEMALHAVITRTPQLVGFFDFDAPVNFVDATPDATIVVAGGESGEVYRLDRSSGERSEVLNLQAPIEFLAVSDDGKTVAASVSAYDEDGLRTSSHSALWQDGTVTELEGERLMALSPSGETRAAMPKTRKAFDPDVLEITSNGRRSSVVTPGSATHWVELPNDTTVVSMNEYGGYMRAAIDGSIIEATRTPMGTWMFGGNLSPDGNKFTYTNGATDVEVWDLAGPLLPAYGDAATVGQTADVQLSNLALSANGSRLATASDGAIYVSDVRPRGEGTGFTTLRGAGPSPHSLKFLSDDLILSASGTSAALWDLRRTSLATVTPADVGNACSACWAPKVAVSPNGEKVVVTNESGSAFVDTKTGFSATHFSYGPDAITSGGKALQAATAVTWLDNDRLFTYDSKGGRGSILRGGEVNELENSFDLPPGKDVAKLAVHFDGSVLIQTGDVLFTVHPDSGDYEVADVGATTITSEGGYAIKIGEPKDGKTQVKAIDTDGFRVVQDATIDGTVLNFAAARRNELILLRRVGTTQKPLGTEILSFDLRDGSVRTISKLTLTIFGENVATTEGALFVEANGRVVMHSLHDGSQLPLLPVKSAVRAWNGLGVTPDGSTLMVASETEQALIKLPISADSWTSIACDLAGRQVEKSDLDGVVASTDGLTPGCGDAFED